MSESISVSCNRTGTHHKPLRLRSRDRRIRSATVGEGAFVDLVLIWQMDVAFPLHVTKPVRTINTTAHLIGQDLQRH
jgi:hypothetical protein